MGNKVPSLLLVLALAFAGCLQDAAEETPDADAPAASAGEPASLAEEQPYVVEEPDAPAATTAHPYRLGEGPPKEPVTLTFAGEFGPDDCPGGIRLGGGNSWQNHPFEKELAAGDVFLAKATLTFTNSDENWGDIHLYLRVPGSGASDTRPQAEERGEIVQVVEAQSAWRGDDGQRAGVTIACWYGNVQDTIPYTVTLEVVFARDAAPAGVPVAVEVPGNATHLYFRGKPVDPARPVTAHWRVFDPEDRPLAEGFFGLDPNEPVRRVPVAAAGEYVILVEHVENGFVSVAANAPPTDPRLRILALDHVYAPLLAVEHGVNVDETVTFTLPRMPLWLFAWTQSDDNGFGGEKALRGTVTNDLGTLFEFAHGGVLMHPTPMIGGWWGLPVAGWDFRYDHHALTAGEHTLHVTAEAFHGEVFYVLQTYLRSGESAVEPPTIGAG